MDDYTVPTSPELLAANRRLNELRARVQAERPAIDAPGGRTAVSCRRSPALLTAGPADTAVSDAASPDVAEQLAIIAALPSHLGWGSEAVTAVFRQQSTGRGRASIAIAPEPSPATSPQPPTVPQPLSIRLYPDIGLGMLRQEKTAPGRLWLLLHHLDPMGQGCIRIDTTKEQLTPKNSSHYLCGKRQLRNLLRAGEGVFWTRDKEHIWLRSAGRVAHALGVERLTGRPVALPVGALLAGIGEFRAHLYAAFHSGRAKGDPRTSFGMPVATGMPIARDTLTDLSGVGQSSQRAYEARLRLRPQVNYAIGEVANELNEEERVWQQGSALFILKDYRGRQGKQGKSYLAWQLPNSYVGQHQQWPKGRQKRINRQLKDLVMKGMPGNDGTASETPKPEKRYYPNGRSASQARGPHAADERYWPGERGDGHGRFALWRPLTGGK